jgi:hypothetical protein
MEVTVASIKVPALVSFQAAAARQIRGASQSVS